MDQATAQLFTSGDSQALLLPVGFRFEGTAEVYIRRDETTDDVILSTRPAVDWQAFMQFRNSLSTEVPADFVTERAANPSSTSSA